MRNLLIITKKVDENDQLLGFFVGWIREFQKHFSKVTVIALRAPNKNWLRLFWQILWQVPRHDAVFIHMAPMFAILAAPWARLWGRRVGFWYTHGAVTFKLHLAEKLAHVIFTASPESFRLPSKKVVVTGHGIDTEHFKPNPKSEARNPKLFRILSVGRIAPIKNYEILIDAAKILKDKQINFSVTIIGEPALDADKNYEAKIKNKIKNMGLENNFNFVGKITHQNLPSYYQSHDVFVHMSKTGSLDKVVLEAIACGIYVLSSNDSSRSLLPQGFIFSESDHIELSQKILLCKNSNYTTRLRDIILAKHNLFKLVKKISYIINTQT